LGRPFVLLVILAVACLLRLDRLGEEPLSAVEACVVHDWQKSARTIEGVEQREALPPVYREPLRLWGRLLWISDFGFRNAEISHGLGTRAIWTLRFYSTIWALLLVALVFHLGAFYFSSSVGALAALLLAVSPPLVATSQDIGPAMEASVLLTLNLACLLRAIFRGANIRHWAFYLLTGALAIGCHPLSIWVILVQAIVAFVIGPREKGRLFYGRLAAHAGLMALFAWTWFYATSPPSPPLDFRFRISDFGFQTVGWGRPTESGWLPLARLLGATSLWGTRVLPSGWLWLLTSIVCLVAPIAYGALTIQPRQTRQEAGFLLLCAIAPVALVLLVSRRFIASHCPPTEVLALTFAPLALWAAAGLRTGLREQPRRVLTTVLVFGGALVTVWSSRIELFPDWERYQALLADSSREGRVAVASRLVRLADFEEYLGSRFGIGEIGNALALAPTPDRSLLVIEACAPPYQASDPADSPAPLIRTWLEDHCTSKEFARDEYFSLIQWSNFDPPALRLAINNETYDDPDFECRFGPFDPGFERAGRTSRVVGSSAPGDRRRELIGSWAEWLFKPDLPPGYYHVFIPLQLTGPVGRKEARGERLEVGELETDAVEQWLTWTLPDGQRKRQKVTRETKGFSFVWEPSEPLRIAVSVADDRGRAAAQSRLVFRGVGLRQHFPYVVDVGTPDDDLALDSGWHEPQTEGGVTYRWSDARAQLTFYLPAAGGIALDGQLVLHVAQRHPEGLARLKFEVLWDNKELKGPSIATPQWESVRLPLPEPPLPGRHEVLIKSPVFRASDPADPTRQNRFGIMVHRIEIE